MGCMREDASALAASASACATLRRWNCAISRCCELVARTIRTPAKPCSSVDATRWFRSVRLGPGLAETSVDERQRAAEREAEHHDHHRQRPRDVEQRGDVEQRDGRPLEEGHDGIDRDGGAGRLDEEDVGQLAARAAIEGIEVRALQPFEQRIPQRDGHAALQPRGKALRDVAGGVLRPIVSTMATQNPAT